MIRPDKDKFRVTQGFGANRFRFGYGWRGHDGIDLGTPVGTQLYAPRSGTVTQVNKSSTYGLRISIDNSSNKDYMGHLSKSLVKVGQKVKEGQKVALSGATGAVTGPHCHWGVYTYNATPINPQKEMDKVNEEEDVTTKSTAIMLVRTLTHDHNPPEKVWKNWVGLTNAQLNARLVKVLDSSWFKAQSKKIEG